MAHSEITIDCSPDEFLQFVLDQRSYAAVDDKMGHVDWVRCDGDITVVKYRPRLPGLKLREPKVVTIVRRSGPDSLDVRLAPLPRNALHHVIGHYHGRFTCHAQNGMTRVTREVCYQLRPAIRWAAERRMRRTLDVSVHNELANAAKAMHRVGSRIAEVVIVGAGPSGIAAAVKLRQAGITDIFILEKSGGVGGTWRQNTYPGCAVDIPSPLYSFSFQPNPHWTRLFAHQQEILAYIERVVETHGLQRSLRTGVELLEARWDDEQQWWNLDTTGGRFSARHVVFASGLLHAPATPAVPGLNSFSGTAFHSAGWDHTVDLNGKRVAVVGTGCSGAQLLPHVASQAGKVYVFQRTAAWVLPRPDVAVPQALRRVLAANPWLLRAARLAIHAALALAAFVIRDVRRARALTPLARWWICRQVSDPVLRAHLTPRFTVGCKRLILSNDYYAALQQPNVELIPDGLAAASGSSLVAADGTAREVDVVVFASGFELRHPPIAARVRGRSGRLLSEIWRDQSPRAYRGTTIPDLPNAYFLLGPNSVMYNSLLAVAEWQSSYIAEAILSAQHRQLRSVEVRPNAFRDFNRRIDAEIEGTAYNRGGCQSIYLDEEGHNFVTNPWSARKLRRSLRKFDAHNYWAPDADRPQRLPDDPAA